MKKIISLLLGIIVFSSTAFCQNISFSKPIKLKSNTPRFKILGRNTNYFIAERWGARYHYLDLYNANLKRVSSKEIRFEKDEKIKKIWIQPKKAWLLFTQANKENTKLLARQFDSKFNLKTKPLVLDSLTERKDLVSKNMRMQLSFNEKYLAVYLPIFSRGAVDYFDLKVYDTSLNKVQKIKLQSDFVKKAQFIGVEVGNDGSVFILFKEKNKTNAFKIYYANAKGELKNYALNLEHEVYKKVKFTLDNKNKQLIVAGFRLFKESKKLVSDAFFSLKIDAETGKISKENTEEFTNELYKLLTSRDSKTGKVTLQTFYIKNIIPKVDGGYLVFAESYYENEKIVEAPQNPISMSNTGTGLFSSTETAITYKTNYFHYNDIIVYTVSNDLDIESVNVIKKRQQSEDDNGGYSSFQIINQQDALEVLFLDEISLNSSLKRFTVNKDSSLDKDYILNVKQNNVMPVVKMAVQTAPNEVLIPSFLNNSFSVIKIVFEEN